MYSSMRGVLPRLFTIRAQVQPAAASKKSWLGDRMASSICTAAYLGQQQSYAGARQLMHELHERILSNLKSWSMQDGCHRQDLSTSLMLVHHAWQVCACVINQHAPQTLRCIP